jgi:hypothetical protein
MKLLSVSQTRMVEPNVSEKGHERIVMKLKIPEGFHGGANKHGAFLNKHVVFLE